MPSPSLRRSPWLALALSALALSGCAAPPPPESDAQAYLPVLATYVSGVWEVTQPAARTPWFFCQSSQDETEQAFNPGGLHPVKDIVPEKLTLILFPPYWAEARFENWEPRHGIYHGYVLARIQVEGQAKEFIRAYTLTGYPKGKAELKIRNTEYALLVGPQPNQMKLVNSKFPWEEPTLQLRRVDTLPERDGVIHSLNGEPLAYQRDQLPAGVQRAE